MWMCRHCVSAMSPEGASQWASGAVLHDHTEFFHGVNSLLDLIHSLSMLSLFRDGMWRYKGYGGRVKFRAWGKGQIKGL